MLKRMLLSLVLSVFMVACLTTNCMATAPNPYPDTSYFKDSKLNAADLNDASKYKAVGAIRMQQGQMVVSYHISIGDVFPKYVSLLWVGSTAVGITYYDSGVFHIWMKQSPMDPLFKKFPMIRNIQESFKADFERVWKDVDFSLLTNS
jgi:hypothetical protein